MWEYGTNPKRYSGKYMKFQDFELKENDFDSILNFAYSVPLRSDPVQRSKWIKSIKKHQHFDEGRQNFNVCVRHFIESDFDLNKGKKILKRTAVPTKFKDSKSTVKEHHKLCEQCEFLKIQVADLKQEMMESAAKHNVEVEKLKQKLVILEEKYMEKIEKIRRKIVYKKIFASEPDEIIDCLINGIKPGEKFSPTVRAFCMSLHFISPNAYNYVRNKFNKNIPHPETISEWYRISDLDVSPGMGNKSLEALETFANDMMEKKGERLVISLLFDEMAIMRSLAWCRSTNKFMGLADCGTMNEGDDFTLANNVIVFMACGINAYFQQPIAFHFIQTLKAPDRAVLLLEVVKSISERKCKIANITFDGYSANSVMCNILGANLNATNGNFKTYFSNPHDGSKIYVIFDPSHMVKLLRNVLGMLLH